MQHPAVAQGGAAAGSASGTPVPFTLERQLLALGKTGYKAVGKNEKSSEGQDGEGKEEGDKGKGKKKATAAAQIWSSEVIAKPEEDNEWAPDDQWGPSNDNTGWPKTDAPGLDDSGWLLADAPGADNGHDLDASATRRVFEDTKQGGSSSAARSGFGEFGTGDDDNTVLSQRLEAFQRERIAGIQREQRAAVQRELIAPKKVKISKPEPVATPVAPSTESIPQKKIEIWGPPKPEPMTVSVAPSTKAASPPISPSFRPFTPPISQSPPPRSQSPPAPRALSEGMKALMVAGKYGAPRKQASKGNPRGDAAKHGSK